MEAASSRRVAVYAPRSTPLTQGLSTVAQSRCAGTRSARATSATFSAWASSWVANGAPKQSDEKQAPVRWSTRPVVAGLS